MKMEGNKKFWDKQAKKHKTSFKAVNNDPNSELLEYEEMCKYFNEKTKYVLDLGCGNGSTIKYLSNKYPDTTFIGLDYSEEMIKQAKKRKIKNASFHVHDITKQALHDYYEIYSFDLIIIKRLFVNIDSADRLIALENIRDVLGGSGKILLFECFNDFLNNTNETRSKIGLDKIIVHKQNEYLNYLQFVQLIRRCFRINEVIDFQSPYYFISRTVNAKMKKVPDYNSVINKVAVLINKINPSCIQDFSPEILIVLEEY